MAITRIITPAVTDDAVTLAKMAPGTDGNLITYDASGNPAAVATGSAGQVLTSAGAGAPPTFAAAGGIANVDKWRMADGSYSDTDVFNGTWSRVTTLNGMPHGTGMTQSSGVFTFPQTGLYKIDLTSFIYKNSTVSYSGQQMQGSSDGFSSNSQTLNKSYAAIAANGAHSNLSQNAIYEITNTSNNKFRLVCEGSAECGFYQTSLTFIRLADV